MKGIKVKYTLHALERMFQRGISKEEVEACIKSPDNSIRGEVIKSVRDVGDKVLVVVYRLERNYALVITAFKSSRKEKYLLAR